MGFQARLEKDKILVNEDCITTNGINKIVEVKSVGQIQVVRK